MLRMAAFGESWARNGFMGMLREISGKKIEFYDEFGISMAKICVCQTKNILKQ